MDKEKYIAPAIMSVTEVITTYLIAGEDSVNADVEETTPGGIVDEDDDLVKGVSGFDDDIFSTDTWKD